MYVSGLLALPTYGLADNLGPSKGLTLQASLDIAMHDNPGLAEIQARYQAMATIPSQQSALPDPILHLNGMNLPSDTFDRDQEAMTQMQIGISQALPFPGKLGMKKAVAELMASAAQQQVAEFRLQLMKNVKHKWWQLYYLDRALETIEHNHELLQQFVAVAQTKYQTGNGLQQDVLLSQLELSKLLDKRIQLIADKQTLSIELNQLMNRQADESVMLPAKVSMTMPKLHNRQLLYQQAHLHSPILQVVQILQDAAENKLNLAKRNYYPDFNLGVTYGDRIGDNPPPMGGERADFVSLMLGVKVPLYAGKNQSQAVVQNQHEVLSSHYAVQDKKAMVHANIAAIVTDYQRAQQQYTLFAGGIVPQATQTVESMLAGYQVSEVDFLNLVRSQMTLLNYELQYWKALTEANQALARLQAAVGVEAVYE